MLHRIELVTGCDKKAPNVTEKKKRIKNGESNFSSLFFIPMQGEATTL